MSHSPVKRLGMTSAAAVVMGNMIGAGVFTTSGFALADLGDPNIVLVAWVVGGVLAMFGALSYGALVRRMPESGGEYLFLSRAVHPAAGFMAGWVSLLAGFTAPIAAAALGLQAYVAYSFGVTVRPEWIGTIAILAAGLMHGLRVRDGVLLQNIAVGLKMIVIGGFLVYGAFALPDLPPALAPVPAFELGAFAVTLVWISFAYSGWNAAVYIAEEVSDPEKTIQRSLILATATVTVVYLGLNAIFVYSAPIEMLAGRAEIGAVAAEALGGAPLKRAVSAIVVLALFTSISSMIMAGPRVYAKMADDGLFPAFFKAGAKSPGAAVALQTGLALVVLWSTGLAQLLGYIGFTLGLSAAATVGALLKIRLREGAERVPIPGFPWVPGIFIASTLLIAGFMAVREPMQAGLGLLTALVGLPLYFFAKRRAA
ncbi:MAG TPA: amino acid permease [Deltaproteobacteria bacterium]|nr:amino acid permease [Candidatus Binatota bacterium]HIL12382.1 amino acid permease [Deltaproteobacteria bacterium]